MMETMGIEATFLVGFILRQVFALYNSKKLNRYSSGMKLLQTVLSAFLSAFFLAGGGLVSPFLEGFFLLQKNRLIYLGG